MQTTERPQAKVLHLLMRVLPMTKQAQYSALFDWAPVGCFTLGEKGIVGEANRTAAQLLGAERLQLVGQPFSAYVLAADRKEYYRLLQLLKHKALSSGPPEPHAPAPSHG